MVRTRDSTETRGKLLAAATSVIRAKGYTATTVDDICAAAGLTKGSFFHHFESKEQLGIAAVKQFQAMADTLFGSAPYQAKDDPRARIFGYIDLRIAMLTGEISQYTCLIGTTVQEVYATHPALRATCDRMLSEHVAMLTRDLEAAKQLYAPAASWEPASVGYFIQCVLQGGFIFAKAQQNPDVAAASLGHLRAYLATLLEHDQEKLRKDHAQTKKLERSTEPTIARPAPGQPQNRKRKEQRR
jgi:TetR/AcrR family transcriptional regulator, transcriptional repressor for nem operon